jgi:hypothetical protein
MKTQNGFAPVLIIVAVFIILSLGGVGYSIINNSKQIKNEPSSNPIALPEQKLETLDPTISVSPIITISSTPTTKPTTVPTKKPTSTPTKSVEIKYSCNVNSSFESDGMSPKLYYGVTNNKTDAYMTAAQWDFDGNGSWDTDLSISNGTLTHKFDNAGNYNVKLQLKMSDGGFTNICNKTITVPQASQYYQATYSGKVFKDDNCNNVWDPNEQFLSGISISFMKIPEWYSEGTVSSDSGGNFSLTKSVKTGEALTLQPTTVAPEGYKIRYDTPALTATQSNPNPSSTMSLVPNEVAGSCP